MTELNKAAAQIKELENRLLGVHLAFETSDDWLWDLDLESGSLSFTGDWYKRLGYHDMTNVGVEIINYWIERIHPEDQQSAISLFEQILAGHVHRVELKYRVRENTGDYFWVLSRVGCKRSSDGKLIRLAGLHTDIDMQQQSVERLQHLAYTDTTTGLFNRTALMDHLNSRFLNYDLSLLNGSVLLIGLDYFKFANTTYGHYVGDRILKTISESIAQVSIDAASFLARYESDQFCLVINQSDENLILSYAEQILSSISKTIHIEEDDFTITASIGIASFPLHGTSFEELLKNAESAMMAAKNSGKNQAVVYQYNMNQSLIERWTLTHELNSAIDNEELRLVFQPIIDLQTNQLTGFEALVRWHSKKMGLVPPNRFIPLAEEIGIIDKIDLWVLRHAIQFIKRMTARCETEMYVSINISSVHLSRKDFLSTLTQLVKEEAVAPELIKIEITEHALITSIEESRRTILGLKQQGIEVFLDDFGTGYSSFNYLKNLPVDLVKLDMSFISDLLKDQQTEKLIDGIVQLAHILDLKICAEGIEELAQEYILKGLSCDYGQGYLYSKPLEESELCLMIEKNLYKY